VAIFTNHTGCIGKSRLIDVLLRKGINIVKIFSPEHGFLGTFDDVVSVPNFCDNKTGIPILSLWKGKNDKENPENINLLNSGGKKPTSDELSDVDVMVFDIQDVGVRFYTYLSNLQQFIEAAAENGKSLKILDRPNPLGHYVDGPVLERGWESFLGMQPIPVVYGMTIGEYAQMLIDQNWLSVSCVNLDYKIIPCKNYSHEHLYQLPINPSPNLTTMAAIYLYPSLCFIEGTPCSVGRGTKFPFRLYGSPYFPKNLFSFIPEERLGATNPKLRNQKCYGYLLARNKEDAIALTGNNLQLKWILNAYELFPFKELFFNSRFDLLAGSDQLRIAIIKNSSESMIRASWEPQLDEFKKIRKQYLLYPDCIDKN